MKLNKKGFSLFFSPSNTKNLFEYQFKGENRITNIEFSSFYDIIRSILLKPLEALTI